MAVVILYAHKYGKEVTKKFKSGGLHERRVVATVVTVGRFQGLFHRRSLHIKVSDFERSRNYDSFTPSERMRN